MAEEEHSIKSWGKSIHSLPTSELRSYSEVRRTRLIVGIPYSGGEKESKLSLTQQRKLGLGQSKLTRKTKAMPARVFKWFASLPCSEYFQTVRLITFLLRRVTEPCLWNSRATEFRSLVPAQHWITRVAWALTRQRAVLSGMSFALRLGILLGPGKSHSR